MGTGDRSYIYGESNGASYVDESLGGSSGRGVTRTHWDPRIEVQAIAGTIQVGIVPASDRSTEETGIWDPSDGQYLSLSRSGANRLIAAVREARIAVHGVDE